MFGTNRPRLHLGFRQIKHQTIAHGRVGVGHIVHIGQHGWHVVLRKVVKPGTSQIKIG